MAASFVSFRFVEADRFRVWFADLFLVALTIVACQSGLPESRARLGAQQAGHWSDLAKGASRKTPGEMVLFGQRPVLPRRFQRATQLVGILEQGDALCGFLLFLLTSDAARPNIPTELNAFRTCSEHSAQ